MEYDVVALVPKLDKSGKIISEYYQIRPISEYIKPYWLIPRMTDHNPAHPEQVVVPVGGVSPDVTFEMLDEGMFEALYLTAEILDYTGAEMMQDNLLWYSILVEIIDPQRGIKYTGQPVPFPYLLGNFGGHAYILPETIALESRHPILVRFYNRLTGPRNVSIRMQIHGQRIYNGQVHDPNVDRWLALRRDRGMKCAPYFCTNDIPISVPINGKLEFYYTNDRDTWFEVRKMATFFQGRMLILDEENNEMQSGYLRSETFQGDNTLVQGQRSYFPYVFYGPWMIKPGGKIAFRLENNTGTAMVNSLPIMLAGRQHFVRPGA